MTNKSRIVDYDNIYIWVHVNLGTQFTVAIQWSNYHKYTLPLKLDTVLISGVHSWGLPHSSQHSGSCKVPVSPEYCPLPSGHMVWNGSLTPWVLTPFHRIQGQGIVPASPEYCPLLIGLRVRAWFLHPLNIATFSQDSGSGHSSCIPWVLPLPHRIQGHGMIPASSEYCPSSQDSRSDFCIPWILPCPHRTRVRTGFLHPLAESSPGMHGSGFSSYSQISLVSDHFQGCQNYIFKIFFNLFISFGYKILNFIEHKLQNKNSFLINLPCNNSFNEHFVEVQVLDNESSKCFKTFLLSIMDLKCFFNNVFSWS